MRATFWRRWCSRASGDLQAARIGVSCRCSRSLAGAACSRAAACLRQRSLQFGERSATPESPAHLLNVERFNGHDRPGWILTAVSAIAIAVATLRPGAQPTGDSLSFCLHCGPFGLVDAVLNVLLFVPLGAGLQLAGVPRRVALAVVTLTPALIELLQATVIPGRFAGVQDVLFNASGGALGILIAGGLHSLVAPSVSRARRATALAVVAWVAVLAATGWAVSPRLPEGEYYWRFAPTLRGFDVFRGRIIDARMAGDPRSMRNELSVDSRARLTAGAPVVVMLVPGPPTERLAPIAQLITSSGAKVLTLGQDGGDLIFSVLMKAGRVRLRSPSVRIERALVASDGTILPEPVTVRVAVSDGSLEMELSGASREHRSLPLTVALGWSLVLPTPAYLGAGTAILSAAWLALIAFPIGYYSGWAAQTRSTATPGRTATRAWPAALSLTALAGGLAGIPLLTATSIPGVLEWGGAVAGLAVGALASLMVRTRAR